MYFARAAVARLRPAARARALEMAGIPAQLLRSPQARVSAQAFAALWLAVAGELDDEFFGLDSRRMKIGSFALLCHAALTGENLDHALRQVLRGLGVFLDDISAELQQQEGVASLVLHNRIAHAASRRFASETYFILVYGLMCWLVGRRIPLLEAAFEHAAPAHAPEYAVMYSEQLRFSAGQTAIRFDAGHLQLPVVQNVKTLRPFLLNAPQSVFLKYKNEDSWVAKVRRRLRHLPPQAEWPVLEAVARGLHVTPTTLRRRLKAEGVSFHQIKDDLRRDAAIHWLCNTDVAIAEVGPLLGFEEPSAFYRAFKKWTGVPPGSYRLRQAAAG